MTSPFRTLDSADVKGKRVLVRVDLNVPLKDGKVSDATRIERVLPTIREISDKGGKVILLAHLGRPKGGPDAANSLRPVSAALAELYGKPVGFAADCIGAVAAGRRRVDEGRRRAAAREHPLLQAGRKERARGSSRRSPSSATSTSTTHSRPPTAPTPRPRASPTTCPPTPAARWGRSSTR